MTGSFLRAALPHPGRLRLGFRLLKTYQRTGLRKLVRGSGLLRLLPESLRQMEGQLPELKDPFFGPTNEVYPARERRPEGDTAAAAPTVALLSGCVMPLMQPETMRAAVRVLTRNGCEVAVPKGQVCCGALNLHAGDLETARRLARRNIDVFLGGGSGQGGVPDRHRIGWLRVQYEGIRGTAEGRSPVRGTGPPVRRVDGGCYGVPG